MLILLNNSFDAVRAGKEPWVKVSVELSEASVSLVVSDSGAGIKVENQAKIMRPFFTTKRAGEGTGLGLSICRSILDSHGGSLNFMPDAPTTTFVLTLPIRRSDAKNPRKETREETKKAS